MSEWLKEHAWKACVRETVPRVRIPFSPPTFTGSIPGTWVTVPLSFTRREGACLSANDRNFSRLLSARGTHDSRSVVPTSLAPGRAIENAAWLSPHTACVASLATRYGL